MSVPKGKRNKSKTEFDNLFFKVAENAANMVENHFGADDETYAAHRLYFDDKSRDRLQIARQALIDGGGEGTIVWTTADNQRVPLGVADFAAINDAAAVRSNALHITYNELKERVNAAETEEEVKAIEWPEGDENA